MEIKTFINGPYQTNTYVISDAQSCFIIDPATDHAPMHEYIRSLGMDPSHILLTHGHSDHTKGISSCREKYAGIILAASIREKEFLFDRKMSFGPGGIVADHWTKDGEDLCIGDISMRFISTPGHTPGGQCIYVPSEKTLFSGDTLFFASVGRTDLWGGDEEKLIASIREKLFLLPDETIVLPGHMEATTIGYERRNNPFVL